MKIKDYKCKCGHEDFFFANKGNQKGIYCSYCGKWLKWTGKDEQNLDMKQEPFINKPCVSKGACHEDMIKALDKIREEIEALTDGAEPEHVWNVDVLAIIDKYKAESEE